MQPKMECRYCLSDDNRSSMIDPCDCEGTMKFVHHKCLQEWIENSNHQVFKAKDDCCFTMCEICQGQIKYRRQYKHGVIHGVYQLFKWIFSNIQHLLTLTAHTVITYFILKRLKMIYYDLISVAKDYFSSERLHCIHHDTLLKLIHDATVLTSAIATVYDILNYYGSIVNLIRCPEFVFVQRGTI